MPNQHHRPEVTIRDLPTNGGSKTIRAFGDHRFLSLVAFAILLLPGCVSHGRSPEVSQSFPEVSQSLLTAPAWQPGQYWEYTADTGHWQNWTVQAREEFNGRDAYRVLVEFTAIPGYERIKNYTEWFDVETLGILGQDLGHGKMRYSAPFLQLFPAENRTYQTTRGWDDTDFTMDLQARLEVLGWNDLPSSDGSIRALALKTTTEGSGALTFWYSPDIQALVALGLDLHYTLTSYGNATAHHAAIPPTPRAEDPLDDLTSPNQNASLRLKVGDQWSFFYEPYGLWLNHSVVAVDRFGDFSTYRVVLTYEPRSPHWSDDLRPNTQWLERESLGLVASKDYTDTATTTCPIARVFPLQDQTYTCTVKMSGFSDTATTTTRFRGWEFIDTPAARFWSARTLYENMDSKYRMVDSNGNTILPQDILYSPDVRYHVVQYLDVCDDDGHCREERFPLAALRSP